MANVLKKSPHNDCFECVDLLKTPDEDLKAIDYELLRENPYTYTLDKSSMPAIVVYNGVPMALHVNSRGGYHTTPLVVILTGLDQ